MKKIKFFIVAGSSAGHILPAIKYINNLSDIKAPNEILFITNEIGKNYIEKTKNDKINKLTVSSKNKLSFMLKIFLNVSMLFLFNRKLILIGFGGFITTPVLLLSLIHI